MERITFVQVTPVDWIINAGGKQIGHIRENADGTYEVRDGRNFDGANPYTLSAIQQSIVSTHDGS